MPILKKYPPMNAAEASSYAPGERIYPAMKAKTAETAGPLSNTISDTTTGLLNAIKTFGMSAVGDAINGVSPKAADAVQKYSLGMIPHTSDEEYEANRSYTKGKWNNRLHAASGAAIGAMTGAMMGKAIPMAANAIVNRGIPAVKGLMKTAANAMRPAENIVIKAGRDAVVPELGHVKNLDVYMNGKQILNQDATNALTIVDKGDDVVVGNIFLPEELRGKGLTKKIYQAVADHTGKPLVSSSKYGLNQSEAGARIWKNREAFTPSARSVDAPGADKWYYNAAGKRDYLPMKEYTEMITTGKKQVGDYISDPRYRSVVEKNLAYGKRAGARDPKQYPLQIQKYLPKELGVWESRVTKAREPIKFLPSTTIDAELLAGGNTGARFTQKGGGATNEIQVTRLYNPARGRRSVRHEVGHNVFPVFNPLTHYESSKLAQAFKPKNILKQIDERHGLGYYTQMESEQLMNTWDVATEMGIGRFKQYPGYEAFKNMVTNYKGSKPFMIEAYKLDTPRDYKRVWDLLTGTLVAGTGAAVGVDAAQKKQDGLLKQ
jgi:hypothetical protein